MTDQRPLNPHLTDTELSDLLLGSISPSVTAHLETCAACAEEARTVSGAILNFEQQSRAWAETQAASQPVLVAPARHGASWLGLPGGGLAWQAMAALTLICAGVGIGYQAQHRTEPSQAIAADSSTGPTAPLVSPATIKADNELLSAINGELQAQVTPPAALFGLDVSDRSSHSHRVKRALN